MDANPLLVVLGPTASGKTRLAVRLADAFHGEIISADSRQLFRGMDIGTGKDLNEYWVNDRKIPYHLIDVLGAGEKYNVDRFKNDFYEIFSGLSKKTSLPILCGGTGLYIHSVLQPHPFTSIPVDEKLRHDLSGLEIGILRRRLAELPSVYVQHADLSSSKRLIRAIEVGTYLSNNDFHAPEVPKMNPFVIGLSGNVETRRRRILDRMRSRFEEGMIDEVHALLQQGVSKEMLIFYGLEYKLIAGYLSGEMSFDELQEKLGIQICQFAKRQMTFFRKMERDGVMIHWFDPESDDLFEQVSDAYRKKKA